MKLRTLIEATEEELAIEWFEDHTMRTLKPTPKVEFTYKDGKVTAFSLQKGFFLRLHCSEIKYPMKRVAGSIEFGAYVKGLPKEEDQLKTLKNFPEEVTGNVLLRTHPIKKIDVPFICEDLYAAEMELRDLKGIHKFVKCKRIHVGNNPFTGSLIDILLIPGLEEILINEHLDDMEDGEFARSNKALKIISNYVGEGRKGVLEAIEELSGKDLDEFA